MAAGLELESRLLVPSWKLQATGLVNAGARIVRSTNETITGGFGLLKKEQTFTLRRLLAWQMKHSRFLRHLWEKALQIERGCGSVPRWALSVRESHVRFPSFSGVNPLLPGEDPAHWRRSSAFPFLRRSGGTGYFWADFHDRIFIAELPL